MPVCCDGFPECLCDRCNEVIGRFGGCCHTLWLYPLCADCAVWLCVLQVCGAVTVPWAISLSTAGGGHARPPRPLLSVCLSLFLSQVTNGLRGLNLTTIIHVPVKLKGRDIWTNVDSLNVCTHKYSHYYNYDVIYIHYIITILYILLYMYVYISYKYNII